MAINNIVTLIGNLGAAPDIIETDNTTFAAASVATTDSYKDDNGDWIELSSIWHKVLVFNPKLINAFKGLNTGARVKIEGSLSYRPYKVQTHDQNGVIQEITKYEASVIARKVELAPLSKKKA